MKKEYIKIYGERNTGTNYLQELVKTNLDVNILPGIMPSRLVNQQKYLLDNEIAMDIYDFMTYHKTLGWKHSLVRNKETIKKTKIYKENKVYFLTITKNPYSWLLSLYKRPYHQKIEKEMSFSEFINHPWKSVYREHSQKTFENPIDLWNKKNKSYIELRKNFNTINLTYENLISEPQNIINHISNDFSIKEKIQDFQNINNSTKSDSKKFVDYQDYYLKEKWREELSPDVIKTINTFLDPEVVNYFNYALIESHSI